MARLYLITSALGLSLIALSYGVVPAEFLPRVMDVTVEGTDLTHVFRGIMGLYLGMVALWVAGAFQPKLTRAAVLAEVVFMFGLAFGRSVSIVVDGIPSVLLVVYAVVEIAIGCWGLLVLRKCSDATGP
jgi:hypothetical protein